MPAGPGVGPVLPRWVAADVVAIDRAQLARETSGSLRVRAELATLRAVFPHVALLARAPVLAGEEGGNLVAVASRSALPVPQLAAAIASHELAWHIVDGADLDAFVGSAAVLTDDSAAVDQLLTPYG